MERFSDRTNPPFTKRSENIKRKRNELHELCFKRIDEIENRACSIAKGLSKVLKTKYKRIMVTDVDPQFESMDKSIYEVKKLKGIMSNMSKLMADFHKNSAHLFDGLECVSPTVDDEMYDAGGVQDKRKVEFEDGADDEDAIGKIVNEDDNTQQM